MELVGTFPVAAAGAHSGQGEVEGLVVSLRHEDFGLDSPPRAIGP